MSVARTRTRTALLAVPTERRLNHAIRAALLGMAFAATPPMDALAADATALEATAAKPYNIPAGPLGRTLSGFAVSAGIALSFDPALTEGMTSPALSGTYAPRDAAQRLLAGSGLDIVPRTDGSYTLKKRAAEAAAAPGAAPGSTTLPVVTITAAAEHSTTTEGTGLYVSTGSTVGGKTIQSMREVPQSVSVVTRQQIEDAGLLTLPDALKSMPGVTIFQGAMLVDRSLSRGFEMGSSNMRVDGGAAMDRGYGIDNDMAFYDHVEVLRGADGLFGGNGQPAGVTNLVRKKPTREKQIIVQGQFGSDSFKRGDIDVSGPLTEDGSVRGRAVLAHEDKNFFFDAADSKRTLAYGILEADLTRDTTLTAGASYIQRDSSYQGYGLPRASTGEDLRLPRTIYLSGADDRANSDITSVFGQLAHRFNDDWRLDVALNHVSSKQDRYDHYFSGAPDLTTGSGLSGRANLQHDRGSNTGIDASLKGRFGLGGHRHDVVLGADWSRYELGSDFMRPLSSVARVVPNIFQFNPYDYTRSSDPMVKYQRANQPSRLASMARPGSKWQTPCMSSRVGA